MDGGRTDRPGRAPRGRRWPARAAQLVLTVLVAWFILDRVGLSLEDLAAVDPARWTPRWGLLALSCLVLLAGYGLSGLLWGRMVRELGGGRVALGTSIRLYMIANLGRYIPGKLWQIAGLALLARQKDVPPRVATGAAVLGQGVALVAATLLGLATLVRASPAQRRIGLWLVAAIGVAFLLALVPPVSRRLWRVWFRLAGEEPPAKGMPGPVFAFRWTALYLLNWGVYVIAFWILVESFRLPGTLFETGPAFAAAYVLGFVAVFAPAGIGVREGFLTLFLAPVMGATAAATLSVLARLWATAVEVLPASALWLRHLHLAGAAGESGGRGAGGGAGAATRREGLEGPEGPHGREGPDSGSGNDGGSGSDVAGGRARPPDRSLRVTAGLPEIPPEVSLIEPNPPPERTVDPTRAHERYLVIIPTYNERENLPRIVPLVLSTDPRIQILVVDDNSPDGTGDLAAAMAEGDERVHVLHRPGKAGLGKAYTAGFRWGLQRDFHLLVEMDADFSHHPDNLPAFIEQAAEHDVVIGSRYVGGRVTVVNWPMSRLLISYFGSWYARTITGLPVRDATGGFNCWKRSVLEAMDLSRVESNGYAFQIELKYRAWKGGFSLVEVPIVFTERTTGESKMSKRIVREAVWKVWKLRFLSILGRL